MSTGQRRGTSQGK